jgi:hypothetical protein
VHEPTVPPILQRLKLWKQVTIFCVILGLYFLQVQLASFFFFVLLPRTLEPNSTDSTSRAKELVINEETNKK